jgi:hypothetical protein
VFVADVLGPVDPVDLAGRLARALATYLSIGSIPSTVDSGLALAGVAARFDPERTMTLVSAICRRGGAAAIADAERLVAELGTRLTPAAHGRANGIGAVLDDDRLSRLGAELAATVAASAIADTG